MRGHRPSLEPPSQAPAQRRGHRLLALPGLFSAVKRVGADMRMERETGGRASSEDVHQHLLLVLQESGEDAK